MAGILLYNAEIVNEGRRFKGYVMTDGPFIAHTGEMDSLPATGAGSLAALISEADRTIDCHGMMLLPGVIDTHVHFRDPGLTEKGDMETESRAAIAGGVTSFVDMPNTKPATVSSEALENKIKRAQEVSSANYGFFIGATNDNLDELLDADYSRVAGIKLFLGSSTGNMLVDDSSTLSQLFRKSPALIAVHAEEATRRAISLARESGARLHVCHISTAEELQMIKEAKAEGVKVTAETCPQYLLFDRNDFNRLGSRIKCNPAIKEASDRIALLRELLPGGTIDTIATDHAPHLPSQKEGDALTAASGMPMVQFSLRAMLELSETEPELEGLSTERIVELMCHRPAELFGIDRRGFIRQGYYADLVLIEKLPRPHKIEDKDTESLCGWTPLQGMSVGNATNLTMVNGEIAYEAGQHRKAKAMALGFHQKQ